MTDALDHLIGHTDHRALSPDEHAALRAAVRALRDQAAQAQQVLSCSNSQPPFPGLGSSLGPCVERGPHAVHRDANGAQWWPRIDAPSPAN